MGLFFFQELAIKAQAQPIPSTMGRILRNAYTRQAKSD